VAAQHDYWDSSSPAHVELPLIGWAVRGIKRLVE
jgi:hypothetical protein